MVKIYSGYGYASEDIDLYKIKKIGRIVQEKTDPQPYYLIEMIDGKTIKMSAKRPPASNKQELKQLKSNRRWIKSGFIRLKTTHPED